MQEPIADAELVNQGAYGCLYYPGLRCNGNTMDDLRYATKLVVQDEVAENEVAVGNAVKNIVNYSVNFVPVIDTCTVNLGKVRRNNPHALDKCDVTNEVNPSKTKFTLMKMPYIDSLYFYDYIGRMGDNKKKIISCIFDTYQYLIESIERLTEHGVVHHDLKLQNILMNLKTDTPINYLQNETAAALTRADVETVCEAFVNANDALSIFSKGFRARYLKACIEYHSRWVGAERDAARAGLVAGWRTWDNYSLSIAYLQIMGFISSNGFMDNQLIVAYVQLLLTNVHPDPARRRSVGDTKRTFTDLFYMKELFEMYDRIVEQFNPDAFIQGLSQQS